MLEDFGMHADDYEENYRNKGGKERKRDGKEEGRRERKKEGRKEKE